MLSYNHNMPLKILNRVYSWLARSECRDSLTHQIFHDHLLCDRQFSALGTQQRTINTPVPTEPYLLVGESRLARNKFTSSVCTVYFRNAKTASFIKRSAQSGSRLCILICDPKPPFRRGLDSGRIAGRRGRLCACTQTHRSGL